MPRRDPSPLPVAAAAAAADHPRRGEMRDTLPHRTYVQLYNNKILTPAPPRAPAHGRERRGGTKKRRRRRSSGGHDRPGGTGRAHSEGCAPPPPVGRPAWRCHPQSTHALPCPAMPSMHGLTPWRMGMAGGRAEGWRLVNVEPPPAGPPKSLKGGGTIARADLAPGGGALLANGCFAWFALMHCVPRWTARQPSQCGDPMVRASFLRNRLVSWRSHRQSVLSAQAPGVSQSTWLPSGSGSAPAPTTQKQHARVRHNGCAVVTAVRYLTDTSEAPSPWSRSDRLRLST